MGLKHLQGALWAIGLVFALAAHSQPQKVEVYKATDPTNYDPGASTATLVLETVPFSVNTPIGRMPAGHIPQCVSGTAVADCDKAIDDYLDMQKTAKELRDYRLGTADGTLRVIRMTNPHPTGYAIGLYSHENRAVVLYPAAAISRGVRPHETGHAYFAKNVGKGTCSLPCKPAGIKRWGVNEGFAKIVAHHMDGVEAPAPSADEVADILQGSNCTDLATAGGAAKCAHDLGNLVFKAYKKILDDPAVTADAFDVYLEALGRLNGNITPAALHEQVREALLARMPVVVITILPQPPDPDPFAFVDWLWVLWAWGIPIYIAD